MRGLGPGGFAIVLALGWGAAQLLGSSPMALVTTVAALAATAATAGARRSGLRFWAALIVVMAPLAVALALLLWWPVSGHAGLLIQLVLVAVLAPTVPLLYAWTFPEIDRTEDG